MAALEKHAPLVATYKRWRAHVRNFVARDDQSDTWVLRFAEHRIVYIPIPKAANSSIRRALLPLLDENQGDIQQIQRFDGFDKLRYSDAAPALTDDWLVFTVVRDPYSRFVSAYLDKIVSRPRLFPSFAAMGVSHGDSIETFARIVEKWPRLLLNDHIMPQTMLLSRAMSRPGLVVHRVEDLPTEWPQLSSLIAERSGRTIGPLTRSNARKADGRHWREYLTPPVRQMINCVYAADFAAFGYDIET